MFAQTLRCIVCSPRFSPDPRPADPDGRAPGWASHGYRPHGLPRSHQYPWTPVCQPGDGTRQRCHGDRGGGGGGTGQGGTRTGQTGEHLGAGNQQTGEYL